MMELNSVFAISGLRRCLTASYLSWKEASTERVLKTNFHFQNEDWFYCMVYYLNQKVYVAINPCKILAFNYDLSLLLCQYLFLSMAAIL